MYVHVCMPVHVCMCMCKYVCACMCRQTRAPAISHPCLPWAEMIIEEIMKPVTAEITDGCPGAFNCGDLNPQLHPFAVSTQLTEPSPQSPAFFFKEHH